MNRHRDRSTRRKGLCCPEKSEKCLEKKITPESDSAKQNNKWTRRERKLQGLGSACTMAQK